MKLKTIIGAILLTGAYVLPACAQVGEQRHNLAVGINGGVNLNSVTFSPTVKQQNLMGINGGITARYISEKYFSMICGAQVEVNFSQHGWDEYYEDYPTIGYSRTMNYVDIPFLAHLAFGKDRGLQFFIHAGPQIGFLLGDSEKISGNWEEVLANGANIVTEQHGKSIDNKFDYGITGGAGIELRTKAGNFLVEGRYYYALSDFYNSSKKDYFSRSAHGIITAKITYLFDLRK
ncbi:porin family protein [uncultured Bacteroides sp.]|uniref:porin family protein n=1 Tax=uncultured Bacteroides sp. TaxID=162156 RepID=UPI002616FEA0|nr:porin family protein [uncultured Bacteroides sp.]